MLLLVRRYFLSILLLFFIVFIIQLPSFADVTPIRDRTTQVQDAFLIAVGVESPVDVTETHLAAITSLNLRNKGITELKSGDFSGLTGLVSLNLHGNQLNSLPDGIFKGLTALTTLRLGGNTVNPLPIRVLLEKVETDQIRAVVPTGAPFDIIVPISAMNGSISGNATSLTVSKGSVESSTVSLSRTVGTTDAVTTNIGTLPNLPLNHYGYVLSKPDTLPLEIISAVTTPSVTPEPPAETETPSQPEVPQNTAPTFTDGSTTVRSIVENSETPVDIGSIVSATDAEENTLEYRLSGVDAASFDIVSTTGQLQTKAALDYETKKVYRVTVTVSDGDLTDSISVIISVIDVDETPFVSTFVAVSERTSQVQEAILEALPSELVASDVTQTHLSTITTLSLRNKDITELKTGDFSGLNKLTSLNLFGNMLESLPVGIFDGLTSLTSLRLGGNSVDPIPLMVALQQVAENQFQAVVHTGAPFNIILPIEVTDGMISDGATEIVIPTGSVKSDPFTVTSSTGGPSVVIGTLPSLPINHFGYVLAKSAVCNRTSQVADTIAAAVPGASDCNNVTDIDLALITSLDLSDKSITSLSADDFAGLVSLTSLDLSNNQLESLPDGFFANLSSLTTVDLSGNSVDPFQLTLSLVKVGDDQFKVVAPLGAPFDIVLPVSVVNGSLSDSVSTISIPQGNTESLPIGVVRTPDTSAAVTVDFGILPNLPTSHTGYSLVKSNQVPLEILKALNVAPVFTEGESTTRSVAERTVANSNIGDAVSATDDDGDTLTYTLSGTDAASFIIDNTNGQLKTMVDLDFEKKTSYSVTITVSDSILTDVIDVTINVTDIDDNQRPVFTEGDSATRVVAENTGSGVDIGSPVSATDPDEDTLTYSLGGTDASSFSIDNASGQIRTNGTLDYETKSTYSVTITVSDSEYSESIDVTINITDLDETGEGTEGANTAPVFTEGDSTTRSIAENTGSGVDIGNAVSATDDDEDTLTYTLGGTDASSFSIDSTSGQLRTNAALDYETKSSYSVTMSVSDGNEGSDSITVIVNITDVDETENSAPVFTDGGSTTRSIAENTGSGVDIGSAVSATDSDSEDTLTYTLSGIDATLFSIDSSSGQLRTSASLDYETKTSYSVTLTVSDGKGGSASIAITINITDVDETENSTPIFTEGDSTSRSIAENTGSGVDIGSAVSAIDSDDDTLSYSLGGTDASSFSIDSSSGQIRTSSSLDYESKSSYSVTVSVSDVAGGSDSISVTINVTDVDESPANNTPVFTDGTSTTRSIAENTSSNSNIGSAVFATDADEDTISYSLSGTDASSFSIDSTSGQLKTNAALNFEVKNTYGVTITASDGQGGSTSITVTINITNVNEAPVFTDGTSTTRSIAENASPGINIGSVVAAADVDNTILEYTLGGTDAASFDIESTTGQLKTKASLDFETKTSYTVVITVSDGALTDSIAVTINVLDLDETPSNVAPVFTDGEETTRSIAENTAGDTNIGSAITATDEDSETLAYLLSGTDASSFSIDGSTGQLKTSAALNYEDKTSYSLIVTVSDGSLEDEIAVTINVVNVNEAPEFAADAISRSVAENTVAGTNLGGVITAIDPDAGDSITYSLGGTDATSFYIVNTSGQLQTKAALDFETKTSYSVTVIATDAGNATDEITVTINVSDVNEAPGFASESTTRAIDENTGTGVNIGDAVSATDPDTNDTLEYSLGGTDSASFTIGSTNGQLRTKGALDFETKSSYSVTVFVSDGNGGTDSIAVTINVNDLHENTAPSFASASTTRSIAENTGAGVNIGDAVSATDPDTDDTLEYTLGETDAASFDIGSTNGQLRTKAALDYETKTSYSVTVSVSDGNGGTDSITVTINVTNVAENTAPSFSSETVTRSIAENTGSGVDIGTAVSATDPDTGDTLEYSLGGTDASSFSINSSSGQLRTNTALDYETKTSYSVTVSVSDGNGETDSIAVIINITNVNEAPAFIDSSPVSRSIAENTETDENIGSTVSATDPDSGDSLTYGLGGTDAASFSIDSSSGQLKTKASLDHETKTAYSVLVTVSDSGSLSVSITVNISITDVNEAPEFTDGASTTRNIRENTASGENIGSAVAATDPERNTLTYTLGGTDAATFSVVSTSGQLQTKGALDYDTKNSYSVTLTVSDVTLSDTITVTINVDENTDPAFAETSFTERISDIDDATVGDSIGDPVTATDDDSDTLSYSLGGTDAALFSIDSESGQLKITQALIDDTSSQYTITVIANDGYDGTGQIAGTIYVTRQTTQMANNAPVFAEDRITLSVAENTASGIDIGSPVTATDADTDDTLMYSLEGTDAGSFSIVSSTGQIQTSDALDYDTKNSYSVTVKVSDGTDSDTVDVTINVTDDVSDRTITPVADRTPLIRDAIVAAISGVDDAADVTDEQLATITSLTVRPPFTSVKSGDLDGLTSLTTIDLSFNTIGSIPSGFFRDNTSLEFVNLSHNRITSLPDGLFSA